MPTKLLQKIQDYKLTTFCAPPPTKSLHAAGGCGAYDLSSVENFATAGEPSNAEVTIQWERLTGKKIREGLARPRAELLATFPWVDRGPGPWASHAPAQREAAGRRPRGR